jgi:GTP-binding protein
MEARYVKSVYTIRDLPKDQRLEIAVAGKSNVGKSSLLNTLTGQRKLAKTSRTPGKTRCLNYFEINMGSGKPFYFVDLPGYGYAQVSKTMRDDWAKLLDAYLMSEDRPSAMMTLFDIRREPSAIEAEWIDWLGQWQRPFLIVLTKVDKLSGNERTRALSKWKKLTGSSGPKPAVFSAMSGVGRDELWRWINDVRREQTTRAGRA